MRRAISPCWFIGYTIPASARLPDRHGLRRLLREASALRSYTEAMKLFNWANGVTNRQEPGMDLAAQLARLNVYPKAVFFTHLHPDHTGGVPALGPQTEFVFGKAEASFLVRAAGVNHFPANAKFL